jgi:hypothetical protein
MAENLADMKPEKVANPGEGQPCRKPNDIIGCNGLQNCLQAIPKNFFSHRIQSKGK